MTIRLQRTFAALVAVFVACLGVAFAGSASGYTTGNASIGVSDQTPAAGSSLGVTGQGFAPGEQVDISEHSSVRDLGSVNADTAGNFSTTVTLASDLFGTHRIVAVGQTSGRTASTTIDVTGGSGSGGGSAGGGSLAGTGVAVIGIGALGLVLLIGGGLMLLAGRRRRTTVDA